MRRRDWKPSRCRRTVCFPPLPVQLSLRRRFSPPSRRAASLHRREQPSRPAAGRTQSPGALRWRRQSVLHATALARLSQRKLIRVAFAPERLLGDGNRLIDGSRPNASVDVRARRQLTAWIFHERHTSPTWRLPKETICCGKRSMAPSHSFFARASQVTVTGCPSAKPPSSGSSTKTLTRNRSSTPIRATSIPAVNQSPGRTAAHTQPPRAAP